MKVLNRPQLFSRCYTVHVVESLNTQLLHQPLHIYKIYKIYTLKH